MPEHAEGTAAAPTREVRDLLRRRREQIAQRWADEPLFRAVFTVSRDEAVEAGKAVVDALAQVADAARVEDPDAAGFTAVREQLARMGAARSRSGLSTAQVSSELAALRPPVENLLVADLPEDAPAEHVRDCVTTLSVLMGTLRVVVMQTALSEGQALIDRQRLQLLEVATPVIKLWDGIVAVPLIGTLDSARSQVVMETLLESIVEQQARYAILDITGVPTVDSLVAQHLMKTVAAARLMGAECIVSGIRPAIAQTMVHLGLDLGTVVTRASLADALGYVLHQLGVGIVTPGTNGAVTAVSQVLPGPHGAPVTGHVPVLRLGEILLVTLQGDLHDSTAQQLQEDLAETIVRSGATGVVIDVSGVEIVDSFLGRILAEIAGQTGLLAARTVLVGMRPAVAITLVELGLTLPGVHTALSTEVAMELLRQQAPSSRFGGLRQESQ